MPAPTPERRSNLILRALIDEMLDRVRTLNQDTARLPETERQRAEQELEGVMARVRRIAASGPRDRTPGTHPGTHP